MAGELQRSFVDILTGSDLCQRRLPYIQVHAEAPGPTVWLTACCHGDEVGGIVVVQEVFKRLRRRPLRKGRIHALPLMNPLGFEAAARHVTLSEEDLNRAFPGDPRGTLAQRMAERIFRMIVATRPALVLDLHNDWIRSVPYSLLDPRSAVPDASVYETCLQRAGAIAFPLVEEPSLVRHTLSHSLLQRGIPALTLELGEAHVVNERNVERGAEAVFRVLSQMRMVDPAAPKPGRAPEPTNGAPAERLRYSSEPVANGSGIVRFLVAPGQRVRAGEPLARVYDAFGRLVETLRAEADALVLGLSDSAVAYPGAPVVALGVAT